MLDFINFIFIQFGNVISFLDSFEIIEHLSILRIFIILSIFYLSFKFFFPDRGGN